MSSYFDVVINNNSFYIVESSSKPKTHDSALETLKKIELVVNNKLNYDSSHQDIYSDKSKNKLFEILKDKSSQIHKGYHEKQSKLNWISRKIFSKEKEVSAIHTRIDNYIQPPQVLPLPNELIQEVAKYLEVSDLGVLAQLNRHGEAHAATAMVRRARELGYEGRNHTEAIKYIDDLFKEVIALSKQGVIQKKHLSYQEKQKKIDSERTLQNLKHLSCKEIFSILANPDIVSHQKFYTLFLGLIKQHLSTTTEKLIEINFCNAAGDTALMVATKAGKKEVVQLLLEHGADASIVSGTGQHSPPIHHAAYYGHTDIVQLFLQHGADANFRNAAGDTALMVATKAGKKEVVQLLSLNGGI